MLPLDKISEETFSNLVILATHLTDFEVKNQEADRNVPGENQNIAIDLDEEEVVQPEEPIVKDFDEEMEFATAEHYAS